MNHLDWDKPKKKVGHLRWDGGSTWKWKEKKRKNDKLRDMWKKGGNVLEMRKNKKYTIYIFIFVL